MVTTNERLVLKGRWEPAAGLAQQAEHSLTVWAEHARDLASYGFTAERADWMRELLRRVKLAGELERWEKRRDVALAVNGSKAFIVRLRRAVPMVLRDRCLSEPTTADFFPGEVGRSASRIVEYLQRIRPAVKRLDGPLRPYFREESPVLILDAVLTSLEIVRGQQEHPGDVDEASRVSDEAKGELLQQIEDLNRIAAIAFHGRAEVIGRFNKDLLLKARRSKTGKAERG
ncbi:MAG: hypothetical protein QM765_14675 [Myxococcales bacterium]